MFVRGDPKKSVRKHKDPINGNSFIGLGPITTINTTLVQQAGSWFHVFASQRTTFQVAKHAPHYFSFFDLLFSHILDARSP